MSSAEPPPTEQLNEVSDRQRLLLANMDEGFAACEILYDSAGEPCDYRFLEVNHAFEQQTGLRAADITGKTALELFPDVERTWIEKFGKLARTGGSERFEEFSHHTSCYYETFACCSDRVNVFLLIRDITTRKRAEQSISQSETRLRLALEVGKMAMWNANYVTGEVTWDEAMVHLLGYQPGTKSSYESWVRRVHPEDLHYVQAMLQSAARMGGEFYAEYRIFSQKDEIRWVEARGHVVADEDGKPVRSYGVMVDITERKRDEQRLQESADILRLALSASRSGVFDRDIPRQSSRWSSELAEIHGVDSSDFDSSFDQWREWVLPEDLPIADACYARAMHSGELMGEWRMIRQSDQKVRWISARGKVFYDQQHKPIRIVGINTDITESKRVEQALRRSEADYAALADLVPQFVWRCTPDGANTYFNQQWVDYTGLTQEESRGANWIKPFHPDDKRTALKAWGHATSTGETYLVEGRLRAADGSYRWFLMRGVPQRDAAGEIINWFGTCTDIDDLKRAQEELRITTQRFEIALSNSPIVVFNQDLDLRYTWIYNPALGYEAESVVGKRDFDLFEHGQDSAVLESIKKNVIKSGMSRRQDVTIRSQGVDRCYDLMVDPQRDANGSIIGVICAAIDRTERKQAELALLAERRLTETVVDHIPCCIAIVRGVDLTFQLINDAYQALAPGKRMTGKTIGEVWPEIDGFEELCRSVLRNKAPYYAADQPVWVRPSPATPRELRYFTWSMRPVELPGNDERGLLITGWETTDRKRTEEALLRSEKLTSAGRMAATVAHEINNPLEAATNLVYLAARMEGLPATSQEYLEMAQTELNRIAHFTRQSLGFYREATVSVQVPLGLMLRSTIDVFQSKISAKQASVLLVPDAGLDTTSVAGELRQLFSNLLSNSLDAIAASGAIRVKVSTIHSKTGEPCVRVTVADNGEGIPASAFPRLFEPFFSTKDSVGTGLGLWVCKQLADKHGGTIRMRSATQGARRGTTFSVMLPTGR